MKQHRAFLPPRRATAVVLVVLIAIIGVTAIGPRPTGAVTQVARINFQTQGAPVPSGYVADFGQGFDPTRGYGWIAATTSTALDMTPWGRDRNAVSDQRLDTFVHMQPSGGATGRWEYAVPNGSYQVTVSVGDASYVDSVHRLTIEGTLAINNFTPTSTTKFKQATVTVDVTDGRMTFDPAGGTNTKIDYVDIDTVSTGPHIVDVDPSNGATGISTSASVTVSLSESADPNSIGPNAMQVLDPNNAALPGTYNTDAAGSLVSFTPSTAFAKNTTYTVKTTSQLLTASGSPFDSFQSTFTTGTAEVPPAALPYTRTTFADLDGPTVATLGPDGKLYVATAVGQIRRYTIGADGLPTGPPDAIDQFAYQRTILGLRFDPSSTASNLKLWVSHGALGDTDMPNFTGKISVLTGPNLATTRDVIVGLPRSTRDHMNNGIDFGPDGKLYIAQGSVTGFGAPDDFWGNRDESPLSAAILVADVDNDSRFTGTVDVTTDAPVSYDAFAATAPVKLYATGTRNPYDLVWHSNGSLYAPVNESAGGNTPAGPNNSPVALTNLPAGRDYFARITAGKYYGHPNPSRGQYVLNGGNPTSGTDPFETPQYPVGQQPDPNYQRPLLDLGLHRSADGVAEFKSTAWNGAITGDLLMVDFSNGDDLEILDVAGDGTISGIRQLATGFNNPLDVTVNQSNGDIYVCEFGDQPSGSGGHLTLLRPNAVNTTPVARVNFQNQSAAVPTGYVSDYGQPFDSTRGYGWIAQDSTAGLDMTAWGRERNVETDQRFDTFIHMQPSTAPAGRWEYALPNGTYQVTVAVGDPSYTDSVHRLTVEGVLAIDNFKPTSTAKFKQATVTVNVTDGRLTLDAAGGTNTKIDYVDIDAPPSTPTSVAKVNFQNQAAAVPTGYVSDYGQPFDSARGYGWIAQDSTAGLDMTAWGRERNVASDQRLDTFIHMQPSSAPAGRWEYALPNGSYQVTVSVGDPSFTDSVHRLTVEGVLAINNFTPTSTTKFKQATVTVNVADGRLTVDAAGGTNTKIDYVDIDSSSGGGGTPDTTPPTVGVTTSGTTDGSGTYQGSATVTINSSDSGSGVASVTYTLDGGPSTPYTAPFTVASNGSHTVIATATDVAGNSASASKTFSIAGASGGEITVISPDQATTSLADRLIFSTVNEEVRPSKAVTVRNDGTGNLTVTNVSITGTSAGDFQFVSGQPTSFTLAPGAQTTVGVVFAPTASGVENYAKLVLTSNDADEGTYNVTLAGLDADDYEGQNEPTLPQIEHVIGYQSDLGTTGRTIGTTRLPAGEELISPFWNRVDTTKPAQLMPLAHYSGRTTSATGTTGWFPIGTSTKNQLYSFPGGSDVSGGQNQRLFPGFTGTATFSPTTAFGLYANSDWTDDAKNGSAKLHNFRAWPARDQAGNVIANTWYVGSDIGGDINNTGKNYDYQDQVYLLTNAAPAWPTAATAGPATSLDFGAAVPGTVVDKDGQGTGFTSTLGNSFDASKIDLQPSSGRLALTSTSGTFSGTATTQVNALQLGFDASRQMTRVHARVLGPLTNLTAANQHEAIFFGPDRDNFAKIEVEYRNGTPSLTLYFEQKGSGSLPATPIALPTPSSITSLDLFLTLDVASGAINGSYLVNSNDFEQAQPFGPSMRPTDVMRWFSSDARAGVLVSNENTTATFTGLFDDFEVIPAPVRGFSNITWGTKTPSPMARSESQGVAVDGKLYVIGGYKDSTFVPQVRSDVYDPAANTWTRLADMPLATTHAGIAAVGHKIYLAGGYITNGSTGQIFATTNVWQYDIDTDTWSAYTPLPAARGSGGLVALGSQLHFFGGADTSRVEKGDHWILDTSSGSPSWTTSAALPNPRTHMGYLAYNGRIWAIGGAKGYDSTSVSQDSVHVWDPAFPTMWIPMANLPRALSHITSAAVLADNRIIVMGGEVLPNQSIAEVRAYDPVSNTWRSLTPLPAKKYSGVAGWIGSKLIYTTGLLTTTTFSGTPS